MENKVLSARVSVDNTKSEYIDSRRISLPVFSSDSGKDIPNYLRASIGSCHDYCKYGKETVSFRQNRPGIKKTAPESQVVFPTVKSAKIARMMNSSKEKPLEKPKSKITLEDKMSMPEDSSKSRDKYIRHSAEFPTTSESRLLKEKSVVRKTGATSGSTKSAKLKRVVPHKVGSLQVEGEAIEQKRNVNMVKRSSTVKKHDIVTKSPIHPPTKLNAKTRPPLSPSPSKLATRAKKPSSSTPPQLTPVTKSRPLPSPSQLKAKSVAARSLPSSAPKKNKAVTLKEPPPLPRNASIKKKLNLKDQNVKKGDAPKTRVTKAEATRRGSIPHTSNTATRLKQERLQPGKTVGFELAETKECREKKEEEPIHAAEFGNQDEMESNDEVPEKTLYVIEIETENTKKPLSCDQDEVPTQSSTASEHEARQCELTNTDKSPPSAEVKILDTESLAPSSTFGCMASSTEDDSTYTESEVDYSIHEDDLLVDGENLKGAGKAKLKKSAAIPLEEDYSKDPVKLTFRRGRVIDITQEDNAPRRLNFRREHVVDQNIPNREVLKSNFKITGPTRDNVTPENCSGIVVLRHQDVQDKKDTKGLFNNVIEETASKLAVTRKSKVKALVGAFETVISLQDGKPAATR